MKTFLRCAIFLACSLSASAAPPKISFILGDDGWFFSISAKGRIDAQFGSNFVDHAYLPEGTVDVPLLYSLLKAQVIPQPKGDGAQVALDGDQQTRPISDGTLLRYLIYSKANKWKFNPGADKAHMAELMQNLQLKPH